MPTALHRMLGLPQVIPFGPQAVVPMTGNSTVEPIRAPQATRNIPGRIGTLPDPTVGGAAEFSVPVGRTVDPGYSVHGVPGNRFAHASGGVALQGQGHYDLGTAWNTRPVVGNTNPNSHGRKLRQGVLTSVFGYNPPTQASKLAYTAALTSQRVGVGSINGVGGNV